MMRYNKILFVVIYIVSTYISYILVSDWIFISDFETYKVFSSYLALEGPSAYLSMGFMSIRSTEPVFILIYWIFSPYSYILIPTICIITYSAYIIRDVQVTWLSLIALSTLILTTLFQAFHLQRQFLSIIIMLLSLNNTTPLRQLILWTISILIHNSAILCFPLFLPWWFGLPGIIGVVYSINMIAGSTQVGGDYQLGGIYYIVIFLYIIVLPRMRGLVREIKYQHALFVILLIILLTTSPYIGSRLYFSFFFIAFVPSMMTKMRWT